MDPVTHGLIGASVSQSFSDKKKIRYISFVGFISALLPDLDVLIGTSEDPLLQLEYHRQFSHALTFIPVGALLASCLLWWLVKTKLSFKETYLFSLLGFATAGIADTFTSYGVQLLWPFTDERFAWNIISVFDPLFSLGLLLAVGLSFYKRTNWFAWLGLCWVIVYLSWGLYQQQKAHSIALELAHKRNHKIETLTVKPTIANEILWSIRYVQGDSLYADGVRLFPFSEPIVYHGESTSLLAWQKKYKQFQGSTLYKDIERFSQLSGGILIAHPNRKQVIGDGRYAMLPTSTSPLWGIKIDSLSPNQHADFKTYRKPSPKVRRKFKNMLLGRQ